MDQKLTKADELFLVVDEHDQPLEPMPRKLVHGHGVWHRVAHVWVFNTDGQVLCQQRALNKEMNPGFWEPFFGGHLQPDEAKYVHGAQRELKEELGIDMPTGAFALWKVFQYHHPAAYNNEFQAVFVVGWNGTPTQVMFSDGEVAQVAWRDITDVERALTNQNREKWTNVGYELALLRDIRSNRSHA